MELLPNGGPSVFRNEVHSDQRGAFEMLVQDSKLREHFPSLPSVKQINLITGRQNSLRGFHATLSEQQHWKIVTCVKGRVRDAVLDLRVTEPTFGQISFLDIDAEDHKIVVIPPGFGHAVQSLTSHSLNIYATNIEYKDNKEFEIFPFDESWENIWSEKYILSKRDTSAPKFGDLIRNGFFN